MEKQNDFTIENFRKRSLICPFCAVPQSPYCNHKHFFYSEHGKKRFKNHVIQKHLKEFIEYIASMAGKPKTVLRTDLRWCFNAEKTA